jgi:hypothetical protein
MHKERWYIQSSGAKILGQQIGAFSMGSGTKRQMKQQVTQPIRKSEKIMEIIAGGEDFAVDSHVFQPGLASSFPWLAPIASKFEKYEVRSAKYRYYPSVTGYNALGSKGRLVLSYNYDALAADPSVIDEAENTQPRAILMGAEPGEVHLDPALATQGGRYVRTGAIRVGADPKNYYAGTLFICTKGFESTGKIGDLFIEYELDLINPVSEGQADGPSSGGTSFQTLLTTPILTGANPTELAVAAADASGGVFSWNNITVTVNSAGNAFALPAGRFIANFQWSSSITGAGYTDVTLQCVVTADTLGGPATIEMGGDQFPPASASTSLACNGTAGVYLENGGSLSFQVVAAGSGTIAAGTGTLNIRYE